MKNNLALGVFAAAMFLWCATGPELTAGESPPAAPVMEKNSAKECALCHISWIDVFYFQGSSTALADKPAAGSTASEQMCFSCHNGALVDSRTIVWGGRGHPVNIQPPAGYLIPKEFPLDDQGRIVCATCHSAHTIADSTRFDQVIFLRWPNKNSELCLVCHRDRVGGSRLGNHPLGVVPDADKRQALAALGGLFSENGGLRCESCHRAHGARAEHLLTATYSDSDGTALLCQICHGAAPQNANKPGGRVSHPVNRSSERVAIPEAWRNGERVRLGPGRRLTCLTCHRVHGASRGSKLLVRSGGESLCLECHGEKAGVLETGHDLNLSFPEAVNSGDQDLKASGVCGACHLPHGAVGRMLWARKIPNLPGVDGVSALCLSCHGENGASRKKRVAVPVHSVGKSVPEGMAVRDLPLYDMEGSATGTVVSCATCHDPHRWDPENPSHRPAKNKEGDASTSFLRHPDSSGSSLCLRCHQRQESVLGTEHDATVSPELKQSGSAPTLCGACHVVHGAKGGQLWAREVKPVEGLDRLSVLCLSCHGPGGLAAAKTLSETGHPVGRPPPFGMDTGALPLWSGEGSAKGTLLSCATCHDAHRWDPAPGDHRPGKKTEGDATTSFLRQAAASGSALCSTCHTTQALVANTEHDAKVVPEIRRPDQGPSLCGSCHLVHGSASAMLWARELKNVDASDRLSALCLSCHNSSGPAKAKTVGEHGHPVGRPVPPAMETGNLPLSGDGPVPSKTKTLTCVTCHDAHRWDAVKPDNRPGKAVEGDRTNSFLRLADSSASALCLRCHPEKETVAGTEHDRAVAPEIRRLDRDDSLCGSCHAIHGALGELLWTREINDGGTDLRSALCVSCHSGGGCAAAKTVGDASHPVGRPLLPGMRDATLPLWPGKDADSGPEISCATCHDAHRWDPATSQNRPGRKTEGAAANSFLRRDATEDAALCASCHAATRRLANTPHDFRRRAAQDAAGAAAVLSARRSGVCSGCHRVHNAQGYRWLWPERLDPGTFADPVWPYCQSCHGEGATMTPKKISIMRHPVGVAMKGNAIDLPLFSAPHSDQKTIISCATCHEPHGTPAGDRDDPNQATETARVEHLLTVGSQGPDNLCARCHPREAPVYDTPHDSHRMAAAPAARGVRKDPSGPCVSCHDVHTSSFDLHLWSAPVGEGADRILQYCTGCHRPEALDPEERFILPAHPQNVLITDQSARLRGAGVDFPLFDRSGVRQPAGIISCPTCHNPHQWDAADPSEKPEADVDGTAVNSFLRNKGASFGFCSDCHGPLAILLYKNFHDPREWKKKGKSSE